MTVARPLPTQGNTTQKHEDKHRCLERDSSPRSHFSTQASDRYWSTRHSKVLSTARCEISHIISIKFSPLHQEQKVHVNRARPANTLTEPKEKDDDFRCSEVLHTLEHTEPIRHNNAWLAIYLTCSVFQCMSYHWFIKVTFFGGAIQSVSRTDNPNMADMNVPVPKFQTLLP